MEYKAKVRSRRKTRENVSLVIGHPLGEGELGVEPRCLGTWALDGRRKLKPLAAMGVMKGSELVGVEGAGFNFR